MNVRTVELKEPVPRAKSAPPRPPAEPAPASSRAGAAAVVIWAALFSASLALAIVGRVAGIEALALAGGFGVVFFGIGGSPFQLRPGLDLYARLTGTILVGFSLLLLAGMVMVYVRGLWSPPVAALLLVVPAIFLHAAGVIEVLAASDQRRMLQGDRPDPVWALLTGFTRPARADRTEPPSRRPYGSEAVTREMEAVQDPGRAFSDRRGRRSPTESALGWAGGGLSLYLILAGSIFWVASALRTRDPSPSYWGMLTTISPLWYIGLAMVLAGFTIGRHNGLRAGLATISFGLATTLTPALVYGAPREQTAAKHMEIVQYILVHHHIQATAGIYQAFANMFSGVAGLSSLLGIHGLIGHMSLWGVATYWPVLLVVMRVAELRFLMGRLLDSTARRWCGVMLVLLVDSLGADYFSPQSVGYVIALGLVAIAMNGRTRRPLGNGLTFALLLLAGVALAPTHELSPYMAAGALVVLAIFGQAPWWSSLPIGVPALAWAAVVHRAVSQNFNFASLFNLTNFQPPTTVATHGLQRMAIVGTQSHMLLLALLILIALGAVGFVANIRRGWAWAYALCPIVGITFIAINPYGNEGIFRATLFAIPWMAVLAMSMPHPSRWAPSLARPTLVTTSLGLTLTTLLATFLIAAYSMDGTNVLPRSNLAVVDYLMRRPAHDAFVLSVGSASNPADGANFAFRYQTLEWSQVATGSPALQRLHPTQADTTALATRYGAVARVNGATARSPLYLIWARSSRLYVNAYGLQSSTQMYTWLNLLKRSSDWRLVDRSGGTYLFERT